MAKQFARCQPGLPVRLLFSIAARFKHHCREVKYMFMDKAKLTAGFLFWSFSCSLAPAQESPASPAPVGNGGMQIHFGALTMSRNSSDSGVIFGYGGNALCSDDFNDRWAPGFEGTIVLDGGPYDLELHGFWFGSDTAQSLGGPASNAVLNTFLPLTLPGVTNLDAELRYEVRSLEANVRADAGIGIEMFTGPRFFQIEENFVAALDAGASRYIVNSKSEVNLFGAQIGAKVDWAELLGAPAALVLETELAGGLFRSMSDSQVPFSSGVVALQASGKDSGLAVMVAAGLDVGVRVAPGLDIVAGYDLLWLRGVTTALEQLQGANYLSGTINAGSSDMLYHGASLKAVLKF